jgi:acyl carrier protein
VLQVPPAEWRELRTGEAPVKCPFTYPRVYDVSRYAVGVGIGLAAAYDFMGFFPSQGYIEIATRLDDPTKGGRRAAPVRTATGVSGMGHLLTGARPPGLAGCRSIVVRSNKRGRCVNRAELKQNLKTLLVEGLKLESVRPEDIQDSEPIFVEGLGLDSIDALELVVLVEERFGVSIPDEEIGKLAFASIDALADFVLTNQNGTVVNALVKKTAPQDMAFAID